MNRNFIHPAVLYAGTKKVMDAVSQERLFNDSQYQKLRESWCAAQFGLAYRRAYSDCSLAVDNASNSAADFFARIGGATYEFQVTESQDAGRARGREYKQLESKQVTSIAYEPGTPNEGIEWTLRAIRKKSGHGYANPSSLHLLVYLNFSAPRPEYGELVGALTQRDKIFGSIWLLTNEQHLCSIHSNSALPKAGAWLT